MQRLGERELATGLLSKDADFRLVVSGEIGVKEIKWLIRKLQLDLEILSELDVLRPKKVARADNKEEVSDHENLE